MNNEDMKKMTTRQLCKLGYSRRVAKEIRRGADPSKMPKTRPERLR